MTGNSTDVLIVGAGPYGLSLAAKLADAGCDHLIVGDPMSFWRRHMPAGMYLRSDWDWYLDPAGVCTILAFLHEQGLSRADVTPFPLETYLDYTDWFQQKKHIEPLPIEVASIDSRGIGQAGFLASCVDGTTIDANRVVLALGFANFAHWPEEFTPGAMPDRVHHTVDFTDLTSTRGQRVLIVGGRQSAFEWAALVGEAGAKRVDMIHRHESPMYAEADWTWVLPIVDAIADNPGWYRNLTQKQQEEVSQRLWWEGRHKVEPWLEHRIRQGPIHIWPDTRIHRWNELPDGSLRVNLDNGEAIDADKIVLATGYIPDLSRVPMISSGNLASKIETKDRLPELDLEFQTTVPNLYITSMLATESFSPFFAFTVAARASADIIGTAVMRDVAT